MKHRYIVYGVTQDAEPCPTPFVLAYCKTLSEARKTANEFGQSQDYFVCIFDRAIEDYIN